MLFTVITISHDLNSFKILDTPRFLYKTRTEAYKAATTIAHKYLIDSTTQSENCFINKKHSSEEDSITVEKISNIFNNSHKKLFNETPSTQILFTIKVVELSDDLINKTALTPITIKQLAQICITNTDKYLTASLNDTKYHITAHYNEGNTLYLFPDTDYPRHLDGMYFAGLIGMNIQGNTQVKFAAHGFREFIQTDSDIKSYSITDIKITDKEILLICNNEEISL